MQADIFRLHELNEVVEAILIDIWESSVRGTHHFLSEADIAAIKPDVIAGLSLSGAVILCAKMNGEIKAFLLTYQNRVEMLFVHNEMRGHGLGGRLLKYALEHFDSIYVDVNEQNIAGIAFYQHIGYKTFDRSNTDDAGRPFPILHMKYSQ